jgi:hypothetical protein
MIAPQLLDARIARLRRAYGTRVFTTAEAATTLHLRLANAWTLLAHGDGLVDDGSRVTMNGEGWWIVRRNPEQVFAQRVADQYGSLLRRQQHWSAAEFADAAAIPYPTANYLLSLLVRFRKLDTTLGGDRYLAPPITIRRRR